jgi:hypothetical protein
VNTTAVEPVKNNPICSKIFYLGIPKSNNYQGVTMKKMFIALMIFMPLTIFAKPNVYVDDIMTYSQYRTNLDEIWPVWNGCQVTTQDLSSLVVCSGSYRDSEGGFHEREAKFHFLKHSSGLFKILSEECEIRAGGLHFRCEDFN